MESDAIYTMTGKTNIHRTGDHNPLRCGATGRRDGFPYRFAATFARQITSDLPTKCFCHFSSPDPLTFPVSSWPTAILPAKQKKFSSRSESAHTPVRSGD